MPRNAYERRAGQEADELCSQHCKWDDGLHAAAPDSRCLPAPRWGICPPGKACLPCCGRSLLVRLLVLLLLLLLQAAGEALVLAVRGGHVAPVVELAEALLEDGYTALLNGVTTLLVKTGAGRSCPIVSCPRRPCCAHACPRRGCTRSFAHACMGRCAHA